MLNWFKKRKTPPTLQRLVEALRSPFVSPYSELLSIDEVDAYIEATNPSHEALKQGLKAILGEELLVFNWHLRMGSFSGNGILKESQLYWRGHLWTEKGAIPFESLEWRSSLELFTNAFRYDKTRLSQNDLMQWLKPLKEIDVTSHLSHQDQQWAQAFQAFVEKKYLKCHIDAIPMSSSFSASKMTKPRL